MWLPSDRLGHVDAEGGRLIRAGQTESGDWDPILEPEASAQGISKYAAKTTDDDLCVSRKRSNAVAQTGWTAAAVDMLPDNSFLAKIYVVVPCVVLAALLVGTAFYSQRHSWTYSTSFYYATQALIGTRLFLSV